MGRTNLIILGLITSLGVSAGVIWRNPINIMLALLGLLVIAATLSIKNSVTRVAGLSIFLYTTWLITRLATYQPIWLTTLLIILSVAGLIVCIPEYVRQRTKPKQNQVQL